MNKTTDDLFTVIDERLTLAEETIATAIRNAGAAGQSPASVDAAQLDALSKETRTLYADVANLVKRQNRNAVVYAGALLSAALVGAAIASLASSGLGEALLATNDTTNGWKDYIWQQHGQNLQACHEQARQQGLPIACRIEVAP
ncbi:hypothetical protein FIV00_02885 [Labrenzia sp. THAF82]|uniref:hypothetical protein n=1 Tax=Labrenzia sp. THAF82 TaxID=2587861 RepID=UPI001267BBBC|nr:hypothetical protein [Labrenzia sp. THAF82]QFT29420.1 hypothetical protein FIV00_02885 [Labrenzia sp. THAF82]